MLGRVLTLHKIICNKYICKVVFMYRSIKTNPKNIKNFNNLCKTNNYIIAILILFFVIFSSVF